VPQHHSFHECLLAVVEYTTCEDAERLVPQGTTCPASVGFFADLRCGSMALTSDLQQSNNALGVNAGDLVVRKPSSRLSASSQPLRLRHSFMCADLYLETKIKQGTDLRQALLRSRKLVRRRTSLARQVCLYWELRVCGSTCDNNGGSLASSG
jgi:hypothetical protein